MKWNVSRVGVRTETQRMRIKDGVRTEHLNGNGPIGVWGENGAWNGEEAQALRDKRED